MADNFVQSLAIALKLDTSDVINGIQQVAHHLGPGLQQAGEQAAQAFEPISAAIEEIQNEAQGLQEPLEEGLNAIIDLSAHSTEEVQQALEEIKVAYEEVRNEASLTDSEKSMVLAQMREAIEGLEQELRNRLPQATQNINQAVSQTAHQIQTQLPQAAQQAAAQMDRTFSGVGSKFKNFAMQIVGPIAGAFAISGAVSTFMNGAMAAKEQAQAFGVASDELQLWQGAITRAGGSVSRFEMSLRRMSMSAKVSGNPLKAMYKLAGEAEKMSRDAFTAKAKELGIDVATIGVLLQGQKALDAHLKRAKEIGIYEQRHIEMAQRLKIGLWELNGAFDGLKNELLLMVLPAMSKILGVLTDVTLFLSNNAPLVASVIGLIGAALAIKLLPPLKDLPKYIGNIWSAFIKWFPIIAVIAGLALIIDDFWGYLTGADSELAEFWALFGTGPEILAALTSAWNGFKDVALTVLDGLKRFIGYLYDIAKASGVFTALGQTFRGFLQTIKGLFSGDWKTFGEGVANLFKGLMKLLATSLEALAHVLVDGVKAAYEALRAALPGFADFADGIKDIFLGILSFDFSRVFDGLINAVTGVGKLLGTLLGNILGAVAEFFAGLFDFELPDFSELASQIWDAITGIFTRLKDWVVDWFKNLFSGISLPSIGDLLGGAGAVVGGAVDMAKGAAGGVASVVKGAFGWFKDLFSSDENDPVPPAKNAAATFSNAMKDAMDLDGLYDDVEPLTSAAGQTIGDVMAGTASTVESGFNSAWSATASQAVSQFSSAASTIEGIFASVIGNIGAQLNNLVLGAQAIAVAGGGMIPAAAGVRAMNAGGNSTTNNSAVNIGTMNVSTRATDANGMARGVRGALNKNRLVQAGQSGVNQK